MPLSTLKVPSNIGLFLLFAFIREMRFFHILALKMLKNAQKCHLPWYFLILDNFCFMTYPQKMPLSTLKLKILDSRIP